MIRRVAVSGLSRKRTRDNALLVNCKCKHRFSIDMVRINEYNHNGFLYIYVMNDKFHVSLADKLTND